MRPMCAVCGEFKRRIAARRQAFQTSRPAGLIRLFYYYYFILLVDRQGGAKHEYLFTTKGRI